MNRQIIIVAALLGISMSVAVPYAPVRAQSIWLDQRHDKGLSIEVLKPTYDGDGISFLTSALYLSGRFPVSPTVIVTAELPVSHYGGNGGFGAFSKTAVGNPYVGVQMKRQGEPWGGALGVRIPLAPDDNMGVITGFDSDFDRFEAFTSNFMTLVSEFSHLYEYSSGFSTRVRVGPSLFVPVKDAIGDAEVFFSYNAMGWYATGMVRIGVGWSGRLIATQSDLSFGERSFHQAGLSIIGTFKNVQPGLHVRLPVDEEFDVNYVLGLNLTILLK